MLVRPGWPKNWLMLYTPLSTQKMTPLWQRPLADSYALCRQSFLTKIGLEDQTKGQDRQFTQTGPQYLRCSGKRLSGPPDLLSLDILKHVHFFNIKRNIKNVTFIKRATFHILNFLLDLGKWSTSCMLYEICLVIRSARPRWTEYSLDQW